VSRDEKLVHEALLYRGRDEFLATVLPFVRDALEADVLMLAVVPPPAIEALRDSLGSASASVGFLDTSTFYEHPVRTIAAYSKVVTQAAPRRVWALAEPPWRGRTPAEVMEWARYESIVNAAFETSGARVICPYDVGELSGEVVAEAKRTHPRLLDATGRWTSLGYLPPKDFNRECDRSPLPPVPTRAERLRFEKAEDLRGLRRFVADYATRRRMADSALAKLHIAMDEVAGNAVRHGTPPMELRVWTEGGRLICEVADYGHWHPDALVGFLPPGEGLGLWGARMLVDLVQIRAGWSGTYIRLHTRLSR
jgi:anti-sigma regulatory factor (Ser/Thr protein kinase)